MTIGLGFSPSVFLMNWHRTGSVWVGIAIILMINLPFILVGALFVISNHLKRKNS